MDNKNLELKVTHLYPEEMNIYGDKGNIITLTKRCEWRGIDFTLKHINLSTKKEELEPADLYFMGGGQDNDQFLVFEDLLENKSDFIRKEVDSNKVFLLICGAYQLFGEHFLDANSREIPGLGILPVRTKAPGDARADRCLGNLYTQIKLDTIPELDQYYPSPQSNTTVGFENHSGQTFFTDDSEILPLGDVTKGKGNNASEGLEGARYKNIFGSYSHGSFLPKNPHFADLLIGLALQNKYKKKIDLEALDDEVEWQAHSFLLNRS